LLQALVEVQKNLAVLVEEVVESLVKMDLF
jgi:hypothetical protein